MIKQAKKLFEPPLTFPAFSSPKAVRDGPKPSSLSLPRRGLQGSPLSIAAPELFTELVDHYGALLDEAVDLRIHRGESLSAKLHDLSARLGRLRAGARDVIELHARALDDKLASASPRLVGAYVEEGRLLVLELMGRLLSYYHTAFLQASQPTGNGS